MNGEVTVSVIVTGCAMFKIVEAADAAGLAVPVFKLAAATPLVPVKANVLVPPIDCLRMTTLVSGMDSRKLMPSPTVPLAVPAQLTVKVRLVIPVPV